MGVKVGVPQRAGRDGHVAGGAEAKDADGPGSPAGDPGP